LAILPGLPKFDKHTQRFYKHIPYLLRAGTHRLKPGVKKFEVLFGNPSRFAKV
jgi:hypothetical protein